MTLGEYIKEYRTAHGMSQRAFAKVCDVSNGAISLLEKGGRNPRTGKVLTPGLEMYAKIARGMGVSIQDLFLAVDDMPVSVALGHNTQQPLATVDEELLDQEMIRRLTLLTPEELAKVDAYVQGLLAAREVESSHKA